MESNDNLNAEFPSLQDNMGLTIRLGEFEGPLDLLLHLIKKEEIDIWNIPIARVTEQYLEYLEIMKNLNINVASEWLLMAATLIYIKSRMLVPQEPAVEESNEDQEDPRKELVYQLLEHQKFKNAAEMLFTREEVENAVWSKPPTEVLEESETITAVTLFDLLQSFNEIVKRFESLNTIELSQEEVTIEQRLADLRKYFLVHDTLLFSAFFAEAKSKQFLIVTFLALLELVRLREIWLYQKSAFDEIHVVKLKGKN